MNLFGKKKIVVKIDMETNETTVEAVGYNGQGCTEATKPFEEALGMVTDRTKKPVFYNQNMTDTQQTVNGGGK